MRIDVYLAKNGHTQSRTRAQQLIEEGKVKLDGITVLRSREEVDETLPHTLEIAQDDGFVGRGGYKLEAALDAFDIDVTGAWGIDVGASTGGFTDCLLRRCAARVYAVDSGCGQLSDVLLGDARVVNIEKCNARYLTGDMLGEEFLIHGGADVIVMDVSFISQTYILPALVPLLKEGGHIVSLIKPQFELDKKSIGKGGVVKDAAARRGAVTRVLGAAGELGLLSEGVICSPIRGGDGNVEYLTVLHAASAEEQEALQLQITKGADALPKHLFIEIKDRK